MLHVVENLDQGAVENWLIFMLRTAAASGVPVDWTFYCTLQHPGRLEQEARKLGARVLHSPVPMRDKAGFARALRAELRRSSYDVLHCHHDLVSAVYLAASVGLGIRRRLVHVHNADESVLTSNRLKQTLFRPILRRVCLALADRVVGISNHTLDTFIGGRKRREGVDVVHYYGIDTAPFESVGGDRIAFRRALGLNDDARVLLFAGRLVPEKNPLFALELLQELQRLEPTAVAVFAGSGSLEAPLQQRTTELKLTGAVRLLGWRSDIAEIMCCCDWFVLPHPEHPLEGFGIAVVEAQLAGMRLLLSNGVADDPVLPGSRYRRLPLAAGPLAWAKAALELLRQERPSRTEALTEIRGSPMDARRSLSALLQLHG